MGYDRISQRDAFQASPTHKAMGRVFFCGPQDRGDLRTANCGLRSLLMFRQKNFGIVADFF